MSNPERHMWSVYINQAHITFKEEGFNQIEKMMFLRDVLH